MTRPLRGAVWLGAALAVLAMVVIGVVQSGWLAGKIRSEAIARIEKATGARVELARFQYDWRALTVTFDGLVIHGREPAGTEPLAAIAHMVVRLRVLSFLRRAIDVTGIEVSKPKIHLMVFADGATNLPVRAASSHSTTQDLLALKVAQMTVAEGLLLADHAGSAGQVMPFQLRADNVWAKLVWDAPRERYMATASAAPFHGQLEGYPPLDIDVDAEAEMDRGGIRVTRARLAKGSSEATFAAVTISGLDRPEIDGKFLAHGALADFSIKDMRATGNVEASGDFHVAANGYRISAAVKGVQLSLAGVKNIQASGNLLAKPDEIEVRNLAVGIGEGAFRGQAELHALREFHVAGKAAGFRARELANALALEVPPWDGIVSGDVDADGRLGPAVQSLRRATANLAIEAAPGGLPVRGQLAAEWNGNTRRLGLGNSWLELPSSRVDVSGAVGERLQVKAQTADLRDFAPLLKGREMPFALSILINGTAAFTGEVTGSLDNPRLNGRATLRHAVVRGYELDAMQGDVSASGGEFTLRNASVSAQGLEAKGSLSAVLSAWQVLPDSAVQGEAELVDADVARLLSVARLRGVEATGALRATARFSGTASNPRAEADVTVSQGQILRQPYDSITARLQYLGPQAQILSAAIVSGPKRMTISARRSATNLAFPNGRTAFEVAGNSMQLNQIALVRARLPDIEGALEFRASGAVDIGPQWHLASLDAAGAATGLGIAGRLLGNSRFTLLGHNDVVEARFDSDAAGVALHGEAAVTLRGDFPATVAISLADVDLKSLEMLALKEGSRPVAGFAGNLRGQVSLQGPLRRFDQVTGTLDIPALELRPEPASPLLQSVPGFALKNVGPIRATLAHSAIRIEAAHFEAPSTDMTVDGTVDVSRQASLNLRLRGTANMALARNFIPDLASSGSIVVDAAVRGTPDAPLLSGRADLKGGDFRYAGFSNGLTNVTGAVVFNGTRATIQSLTGETGGGKVDATGFVALTGASLAFRLDAQAGGVRVRYPEGVSSVSDVSLTVAGTSARSEASGVVTIHRLAINPRADLAAIIASAGKPQPALAGTGLMANMNLDLQVATASDVAFESNVAQSIQADASLRLRGTAANPALLGRINISHGELMFFGNKYTVSQGAVSFYNAARIEPVLNLDLTTRARGVDVVLTVAGPADKLNMSYRSDPPLEFSDIINLLATGRSPNGQTTASRGTGPTAAFDQLGADALLGQALANPVADRLQRFFGVSRLKIDPQLTGVTGSPQARLTIEQQVTPDILFTYITDVARTNNQLVRVEWTLSRQVSAILVREENGYVGVDFAWKKRFK